MVMEHPTTMTLLCPDCMETRDAPSPAAEGCVYCDHEDDCGWERGSDHADSALCLACQGDYCPAQLVEWGYIPTDAAAALDGDAGLRVMNEPHPLSNPQHSPELSN